MLVGGNLTVSSEPGRGMVIEVTIPVANFPLSRARAGRCRSRCLVPDWIWLMDRNYHGVARIARVILSTHVLVRLKSDISLRRTSGILPDGSTGRSCPAMASPWKSGSPSTSWTWWARRFQRCSVSGVSSLERRRGRSGRSR